MPPVHGSAVRVPPPAPRHYCTFLHHHMHAPLPPKLDRTSLLDTERAPPRANLKVTYAECLLFCVAVHDRLTICEEPCLSLACTPCLSYDDAPFAAAFSSRVGFSFASVSNLVTQTVWQGLQRSNGTPSSPLPWTAVSYQCESSGNQRSAQTARLGGRYRAPQPAPACSGS